MIPLLCYYPCFILLFKLYGCYNYKLSMQLMSINWFFCFAWSWQIFTFSWIPLNRQCDCVNCNWINECSQVLAEDENDVKALFRWGKARAELGQTDAAREDFLKARKFAPQEKAIARELRLLLAEHDKVVYQKQKEIYKGILGPTPEPKPKRDNWLIIFWNWLLSLFYRLFRRERHNAE